MSTKAISESDGVRIEINDLFEELSDENNRLLSQLLFVEKCLKLFEKYRNFLNIFCDNCKCDQNIESKLKFSDLENEYKSVFSHYQNEVQNKVKVVIHNKSLSEKKINNNVNTSKTFSKSSKFIRYDNNHTNNNTNEHEKYFINENKINLNESEFDSKITQMKSSTTKVSHIFRCNYTNCDYKSRVKENILKHIQRMHTNKKPINCNKCSLTFWGQKRLTDHVKQIHIESYDQISGKFKCDWNECSFQSKSFSNLTIHKMRHLGEKPFKCDYPSCEWSFVSSSEMKWHQKLAHSVEKPFVCDWMGCNAQFKQNKCLNIHKLSHTGDKPFKCEWPGCEAGFYRNSGLLVHKSSHEGLKKFSCEWPECGQKFRNKMNLKRHYLIHTDEKPYLCEWPGCEAKFRVGSSLNRHKLVHKVGADFVCDWPQCGKRLRSKGSLKQHIMSHKGEKPFKCEWKGCESRFVDRRQMNKHFKRRHTK